MERGIRNHILSWERSEKYWGLQRGQFSQHTPEQETGTEDAEHPDEEDALYCAECHAPITSRCHRIAVNEQYEHFFANPAGYIYHIGCFREARGCMIAGEETDYFTWFPGYAWRYALCGQCINLLGWAFRSQDSLFFGLIVEKLLES
jgi:hypothetical protein